MTNEEVQTETAVPINMATPRVSRPSPSNAETAAAQPPSSSGLPYPRSPVIQGVVWDFSSLTRAAMESDLFPLTWAADGNLYTTWGDGWGFSQSGSKRFLGVSRVLGGPEGYKGLDLWSGVGKANGILAVDGTLYMVLTEQDAWKRGKMGYSKDFGQTWTFDTQWTFDEPGGVFAATAFLQFGRDYEGARDAYVYGYSERVRGEIQPDMVMFRVPKDRLMDRSAYEFFAGLDSQGSPTWTGDIQQMRPVFSNPMGVTWGMQIVYHPVLHRYLLTVRQKDDGSGWAIFDAPEPWGPWTTVAYYEYWLDGITKLTYSFNQKWMDADGLTMWMVFSGVDKYDSFNVIKATFQLR